MKRSCAGVVPIDGAKMMLGRDYRGLWSSFAGKVEPGESLIEAAVREFNEETSHVFDLTQAEFHRRFRYHLDTYTPSGMQIRLFLLDFADATPCTLFHPNPEKTAIAWGWDFKVPGKFRRDYCQIKQILKSNRNSP